MKPLQLSILLSLSLPLVGCGDHVASVDRNTERLANTAEALSADTKKMADELERDREYVQAISRELSTMAKSMDEFRSLASLATRFLSTSNANAKPSAPAATPDIDDILGGKDEAPPAPAASPSPIPVPSTDPSPSPSPSAVAS